MALLTSGTTLCGFCYTVRLGLQQYCCSREAGWNLFSYLDSLANRMSEYVEQEFNLRVDLNLYVFDSVA